VKWRRKVGNGFGAAVALGDKLVLLHRVGDEEIVECFGAETGKTLWQFTYPTTYETPSAYSSGPYSTPLLEGDRVYAWGAQGQFHCLHLDDGEPLWSRMLNDEYRPDQGFFPVAASPMIENELIVVNVGGTVGASGIVAMNKHTGENVWMATDHGQGCATARAATIHGRRLLFLLTNDGLVCLDPPTGAVLWVVDYRPKNPEMENATSPLVYHDLVMVSVYAFGSLCVRVLPDGTYEELWRNLRTLDSQYNTLICVDGYVYGFSALQRGASFRCLDLTTGELQWKFRSRWLGRGMALAVDEKFLLLGDRGRLGWMDVDPRQPVERAATEAPILEGPCYTAPALHRGLLYVRDEHELICLDLRPGGDRNDRRQ
jgi:outer membrane protein assembly factor BamB